LRVILFINVEFLTDSSVLTSPQTAPQLTPPELKSNKTSSKLTVEPERIITAPPNVLAVF